MPAPDVYSDGIVDPFLNLDESLDVPSFGILYATDRVPGDGKDKFYKDERGFNLRLGVATTELGTGEYTWEEARRISLLKNRSEKYPVKVTDVEEFGILDRTITTFTPPELISEDPKKAAKEFAQRVKATRLELGGGFGIRAYKAITVFTDEKVLAKVQKGGWALQSGAEVAAGSTAAEGSVAREKKGYQDFVLPEGGASATLTIRVLRLKPYF